MKVLLFLTFVGLSVAQCPPASVLHPCYCEASIINCNSFRGEYDFKAHFDRVSEFVGDDVVFSELTMYINENTQLGPDTVEHLKFERISVWSNLNLEYISPRAFSGSRNTTTWLNLYANVIGNDVPRESDIFDLIKSFPNLETLEFSVNQISSIPDDAFLNLHFLENIVLRHNNISRIGSRAFNTNSDDLRNLSLAFNHIPSEGLPLDAFHGLSERTFVDLQCNDFEYLDRAIYQTLLDRVGGLKIGGFLCPGHVHNQPQRFICDERADWLCEGYDRYWMKLEGFRCTTLVEDVWQYCFSRNKGIHQV